MSIEEERERITNRHPIWHYNPSLGWGDVPYSVAPYVPTPLNVVKIMLNLVNANNGDVLFDLGCGDGRILFTAVEDFGVKKAVGYDLNSGICKIVQEKIENKGLKGRVIIINDNFFNANLSSASVVTLYLTTSGNSKLKPKLEKELNKGTRIVSHDFPIHGWITKNVDPPYHYTVGSHKIFVYQIPEAYQGQRVLNHKPDESSRWKKLKKIFLNFNE